MSVSTLSRPDAPSASEKNHFNPLPHPILVHDEVMREIDKQTHLKKRLAIVLTQLAAHGRSSVFKICHDERNKGWMRTPMGGGGTGMQFYLWWTPPGSPVPKGFPQADGHILVRALRHHDEHADLSAGKGDEYLDIGQNDMDGLAEEPLTKEQLDFVRAEDQVRLALGRPGSGKTTALWKAIEARAGQSVLYLTWSRELTRNAREHFAAFAPADVRVKAMDFLSFVGAICGNDVKRQSLMTSLALFRRAFGRLTPKDLGVWANRASALFSEVRSCLIGRSLAGDFNGVPGSFFPCLSDRHYRQARGDDASGVGRKAAEQLLAIMKGTTPAAFVQVFPELHAAMMAAQLLRQDKLPDGFDAFDRVVVDELQDMTLLEVDVVVEFCLALGRRQGFAPWLLMAGDDGQTVRPTGFDWGPYKKLIGRCGKPREFYLEENLRCPARIAAVVQNASNLYKHLEKGRKPRKQGRFLDAGHVEGQTIYVAAEGQRALGLIERLAEVENLVVLFPGDGSHSWLPKHLREAVLYPAQVKGLEYQTVVAVNVGKMLETVQPALALPETAALEEHRRRTAIDQLRVVLSRATETLVFLDIAPSETQRRLSGELLAGPVLFSPEELLAHVTTDTPPEERVRGRLREARALLDDSPEAAWRRLRQAVSLLGKSDVPGGVADRDVRDEARSALVAAAVGFLVDGPPAEIARAEILEAAHSAISGLEEEQGDHEGLASPEFVTDIHLLLVELDRLKLEPNTSPLPLLRLLSSIHGELAVGGNMASARRALFKELVEKALAAEDEDEVKALLAEARESVEKTLVRVGAVPDTNEIPVASYQELEYMVERARAAAQGADVEMLAADPREGLLFRRYSFCKRIDFPGLLSAMAQDLRGRLERDAERADTAEEFADTIENYLDLLGFTGDVAKEARRLRIVATRTLLAAKKIEAAARARALIIPEDPLCSAHFLQARGQRALAARAFAAAGAYIEAMGEWRAAGCWDEALAVAETHGDAESQNDLRWFVAMRQAIDAMPAGLPRRAGQDEIKNLAQRFTDLLDSAKKGG